MTKTEITQIRALFRCRFGHREYDKRFVVDLNHKTRTQPERQLNHRQLTTLTSVLYRYRSQLERLLPESLRVTDKPKNIGTVNDLFSGRAGCPHKTQPRQRQSHNE